MSNNDQLKRIEEYQNKGANFIPLCEWERLPEFHQLIVEEVWLSPNTDDKDVFKQDKKLAIHFQGLTKLALAAGIEWDPDKSRVVTSTADYCHYQAVAFIQREYGKRIVFRGDAEMDMVCIKEDLIDEYTEKARKDDNRKTKESKQAYVDFCVNRDFRFKRKHKLKLVATSAKGVVINKILGLKGGYTAEELQRPFVVIRCVVAPDLSDVNTRQKLLSVSLNAIAGVYGNSPESRQIGYGGIGELIELDPSGYGDALPPIGGDDPPPPPVDDEPPPPPAPPDSGPEMTHAEADFMALDTDGAIKTLRILVARKGYDLPDLEARRGEKLEKFHEKTMLGLFKKISAMPDKI